MGGVGWGTLSLSHELHYKNYLIKIVHAWLLHFRVIEQVSNMYFQVSNESRNNLPASIIVRNELLIIPHAGSLYININTYNFMCSGKCFSIQVSIEQNSHVGMPHRRLNVQMFEKENFK